MDKLVVSKVLVLDEAKNHAGVIKAFYEECCLVGIRPHHNGAAGVMAILKSNVDLGGIMLYEHFGGDKAGIAMAREIHQSRPELPIFLRRDAVGSMAGLDERDAAMFRCAFTLADLAPLRASLEASIFSRVYPNDLVRGITEITRSALETLFRQCDVEVETPYLVKDRIIYGEVFSMIAIESHWCRGYMMLQAEEDAVLGLIGHEGGQGSAGLSFRDLNGVLGEATNLVWGAFKNRYVNAGDGGQSPLQTQVPIMINHQRRYISFGSEDPQLCLKYVLREGNGPAVPLYQRFVFNLNWSPDKFTENPSVESFVASGELEMF